MKDSGFTVIAVAMDNAGAARPWIEAARPDYPCLIDRDHHLGELYAIVNVPQATWFDEDGRIVRPPENAGSSDAFRAMDRKTRQMTADQLNERERMKAAYVEAVRDWAEKGAASAFAYAPEAARARLRPPNDDSARAHAHFRLARHLLRNGANAEAARHYAEASRLHPDSWTIWRQAADKEPTGLATSPEFWARVDALGDRPYHRPIDMKGIRARSRPAGAGGKA